MNSICNFIPAKNSGGNLKTVHFVYETEFKKLKQPFLHSIYYMHLVTRGDGILKLPSGEYRIEVGSLFFAFPGVPFEIYGSDDLTYMYISYMGLRAHEIAAELNISLERPVFYGFEEEVFFWKGAIQRIDSKNANLLSESVLLYTLSYLSDGEDIKHSSPNNVLEKIINYIDNNYNDPDMSLKKIADIFAYTDKYLSHLFKESMQMNFTQYLTRLRVQKALDLIGGGLRDTDEIALQCGYRDTVYFSKVFKKFMCSTPNAYIKQKYQK